MTYTISLPVSSKWVIFVCHGNKSKWGRDDLPMNVDPHQVKTFNCDKQRVADWCCDYTNGMAREFPTHYLTGGAHWVSLGNTLEVFYEGEHIQSIDQVPTCWPSDAHRWLVTFEYLDEDTYNWELDFADFSTEKEARHFMTNEIKDLRSSLTRELPNGTVNC